MFNQDINYVLILLGSIGFGKVTRLPILRANSELRKLISSVAGFTMAYAVSGIHVLHLIFSIFMQIFLLKIVPHNLIHWVSFVCGFAHLFFFRLCGKGTGWPWSIFESPPGYTNATLMILTIKMIGLAFEVHDTAKMSLKSSGSHDDQLEKEFRSVHPSSVDVFHYGMNHAGLLTGPYYKFRTFKDMYDYNWSTEVHCESFMWKRIRYVPIYAILYLVTEYIFPLDAIKQDSYYEETSFLTRILLTTPYFISLRMRLYVGFILSECSCIMAGLGAYPSSALSKPGNGPTKLAELQTKKSDKAKLFDFQTVYNIDVYKVETVWTMREALRVWNMTAQFWLVNTVYKRLPGFSKGFRTTAVMVVSAAWHGVRVGYYFALGTVALMLPVEDLYQNTIRKKWLEHGKHGLVDIYELVSWVIRVQWFSYLNVGFRAQEADVLLKFWSSIGFIGHLHLPVAYIVCLYIIKPLMNMLYSKKGHSGD